jgi:hypothetical protein
MSADPNEASRSKGSRGTIADPLQRCGDHLSLVVQPIIVHAAAAPDDLLSAQPQGGSNQSRGGCRVANPHVADDQQIRAGADLIEAIASPARSA